MTGARIVLTKNGVVDYGSLHEVVFGLRSWIFGPSVLLTFVLKSHSHRGFSPVNPSPGSFRNRFNGFLGSPAIR